MSPPVHPAYGVSRPVTQYAKVVLAHNPGHMTLDGTNTWILGDPDAGATIVVDPGPDDAEHIRRVADLAGQVSVILLTHGHDDHSGGAERLFDATGAPVRAVDAAHRHGGASGLQDGELVEAAGLAVRVLATPGHTADSVCFVVEGVAEPAVLTGDTILGRGTTVVAHPDGVLGDYLDSLTRLASYGDALVLPRHGPDREEVGPLAQQYLEHRATRLQQVRDARDRIGSDASPRQVVEVVYADVDPVLWDAAELSVRAALDHLGQTPDYGPPTTDR